VDVIGIPGRCRRCSIVFVVIFVEAQLGLLKIHKKCGVIGKVKLQALIGDPWVKNCWDVS